MAGDAYTGLRRRKQTPWSVTFGDAVASRIIAVGGIGTIAAILLVVLVLLGTALPLVYRPSYQDWHTVPATDYQHVGVDDNGLLAWGMTADGTLEVRGLHDGTLISQFPLTNATSEGGAEADGPSITCSYVSIDRATLALGFSDGTFRVTDLQFDTRLMSPGDLPEGVSVNAESPLAIQDATIFQWIDASGVRKSMFAPPQWSPPRSLGDAPVVALDYLPDSSANRLATTTEAHALAVVGQELVLAKISGKTNRLTRKVTETVTTERCSLEVRNTEAQPLRIMLMSGTDHGLVVWPNGALDRYSLSAGTPKFIESQSAVVGDAVVNCAAPLLARQNLLCGLNNGRLQGWMVVRSAEQPPAQTETTPVASADGYQLVLAHDIQASQQALISVVSSEQTHVAVTADAAGHSQLVYVTTDTLLSEKSSSGEGDLQSVNFDPSGNLLVARSSNAISVVEVDIGHPEASWKTYFGRVWYEGHDQPKYIWQSSSGTEKSEIKLSLMPLVFGTLKATVYAMIISVPLAILAAIYTSEFLSPAVRGRIKPVIELMASLPSVVLGYIAALVVAPYLQEHLLAVLIGLVIVPLTFVLAGHLWNLLAVDLIVRLQPWRLPAMAACLPIAIVFSAWIAGPVEDLMFGGSLIQWLGSGQGSAVGGWMILLMPAVIVLVCLVVIGPMGDFSRSAAISRTPKGYALFSLLRLAVVAVTVMFLTWAISAGLSLGGFDLRGSFFDNYQDRNALLVGGALGFCVIPIIYTISDDALQAVPSSLRSASLGCGATPWQTTIRVVVPSAMSGLFSAVMIGLGRAVGETMVVLMAAGNTPVMEWNPFNGFRTLSATLATELPEAAKGSTHFRTLFLAALLLFFLTLIANTFAEFVRIRFRKRASQL
ncbi:MAG: ABC transporter permease subunit [Pirellulaceae bacterium]